MPSVRKHKNTQVELETAIVLMLFIEKVQFAFLSFGFERFEVDSEKLE
jgi:hypothetical protein